MTAARTPGPWVREHNRNVNDDTSPIWIGTGKRHSAKVDEVVCRLDWDESYVDAAKDRILADADFIVEACNAHDGLQNKVDVLMAEVIRLREALANIGQPPSSKNRMTLAAAIGIARAALVGVGK